MNVKHSRRRSTVQIPIESLPADPDWVMDERFVQLYRQLLNRESTTAFTRLPINSILSGFYRRKADKTIHVTNLKPEYVPVIERAIRGGSRPRLVVYWSPLATGGGRYVCADDETA